MKKGEIRFRISGYNLCTHIPKTSVGLTEEPRACSKACSGTCVSVSEQPTGLWGSGIAEQTLKRYKTLDYTQILTGNSILKDRLT